MLSAVLMGMISWGMTGRILEPPAARRSSTPCNQFRLIRPWPGSLAKLTSRRVHAKQQQLKSVIGAEAHPDGHEAQRVGGLPDAVKEDGEVVVVVQSGYVHLQVGFS